MGEVIKVDFGSDSRRDGFNYKEDSKGLLYDAETLKPLSLNDVDSLPYIIDDVKRWTQDMVDRTVDWLGDAGIEPVDGYSLQSNGLYFPIYEEGYTSVIRNFTSSAKKAAEKKYKTN